MEYEDRGDGILPAGLLLMLAGWITSHIPLIKPDLGFILWWTGVVYTAIGAMYLAKAIYRLFVPPPLPPWPSGTGRWVTIPHEIVRRFPGLASHSKEERMRAKAGFMQAYQAQEAKRGRLMRALLRPLPAWFLVTLAAAVVGAIFVAKHLPK